MKISGAISDNANNIKRALKDLLKLPWIGCLAHGINLIFEDAYKASEFLKDLRNKVSKVVAYINRSTSGKSKFNACKKTAKTKDHQLIQDVITRWNSCFLMFERFLEQKDALVLFLADEDDLSISSNDWLNIKIFCEVLEPLYFCTKEICAEKITTLSKVIPIVKNLKRIYGNHTGFF